MKFILASDYGGKFTLLPLMKINGFFFNINLQN